MSDQPLPTDKQIKTAFVTGVLFSMKQLGAKPEALKTAGARLMAQITKRANRHQRIADQILSSLGKSATA